MGWLPYLKANVWIRMHNVLGCSVLDEYQRTGNYCKISVS